MIVDFNNDYVDFDSFEHKYTICGVALPSVSELLTPIVSDMSNLPDKYRERGTAVHKMTEEIDQGVYVEPGQYKEFINAYKHFIAKYNPIMHYSEQIGLNSVFGYCGTLDRIFQIGDSYYICDIKTGNSATWHPVQLYLYKMFFKIDFNLCNVYLHKDGSFKFTVYDDDSLYEEIALSLIKIWMFKNKTKSQKITEILKTLEL